MDFFRRVLRAVHYTGFIRYYAVITSFLINIHHFLPYTNVMFSPHSVHNGGTLAFDISSKF